MSRVLHPCQPRLEEGEPGLHEHHEHRGDDYPDRVDGDQEVCVLHRTTPVLLCLTFEMGLVQTRPSPDSLPLRAASTIASTTARTAWSSTTKVRSAFGRNRDSNTRPRYSCVIPRWRPWPIASTTVTPTWPVSSSTASITVSTRSRSTTASTLVIESPRFVVRAGRCRARGRRAFRSPSALRRRGTRALRGASATLRS